MKYRITIIDPNNYTAGAGYVRAARSGRPEIECAAALGDGIYTALESALDEGTSELREGVTVECDGWRLTVGALVAD